MDQRRVAVRDRALRAARHRRRRWDLHRQRVARRRDLRGRFPFRVAPTRRRPGAPHRRHRLRRGFGSTGRPACRGRGVADRHRARRARLAHPPHAAGDRVRVCDDRLDQRSSVGGPRSAAGLDHDADRCPPLDRCRRQRRRAARQSLRMERAHRSTSADIRDPQRSIRQCGVAVIALRSLPAAVRDDGSRGAAFPRRARQARQRLALRDIRDPRRPGVSLRAQSGSLLRRDAAAGSAARQHFAPRFERAGRLCSAATGLGFPARCSPRRRRRRAISDTRRCRAPFVQSRRKHLQRRSIRRPAGVDVLSRATNADRRPQ